MRISDWSSDVCSSDLGLGLVACRLQRRAPVEQMGIGGQRGFGFFEGTQHRAVEFGERRLAVSLGAVDPTAHRLLIGEGPAYQRSAAEQDRKSVVSGTTVSGRGDLGGRRTLNKKN